MFVCVFTIDVRNGFTHIIRGCRNVVAVCAFMAPRTGAARKVNAKISHVCRISRRFREPCVCLKHAAVKERQ